MAPQRPVIVLHRGQCGKNPIKLWKHVRMPQRDRLQQPHEEKWASTGGKLSTDRHSGLSWVNLTEAEVLLAGRCLALCIPRDTRLIRIGAFPFGE